MEWNKIVLKNSVKKYISCSNSTIETPEKDLKYVQK